MLPTLPVKNEDGARAFASVQLNKGNEIALRTSAQWNMAGSHAWQTHAFVLDVPADASSLVLDVGLSGSGAVLLDEPKLEAAGPALSTTGPCARHTPSTATTTTLVRSISRSRGGCTGSRSGPVEYGPGLVGEVISG